MVDVQGITLKQLLESFVTEISNIEARGHAAIGQGKEDLYRNLMREKATLLSTIEEKSRPFLDNEEYHWVQPVLENFAMNAKNSLELDSVFYMSALLYNDDHAEGQLNNLEILVSKILP